MSVALNMIVGPYEEPFLEAAILSTKDLCWDFVLIDTAPDNNPNRMIMENVIFKLPKYDKRVRIIDMPRGEDKDFSFAAARELARVNTESEWVLRFDADEVLHEDNIHEIKAAMQIAEREGYTGIECGFYHHMIYPWLYQYIEPRVILMRTNCFSWKSSPSVHETPNLKGKIFHTGIKYHHYGYCRGQEEVFKRWKLYMEIDNNPHWYDGYDPNNIITDRLEVCQNLKGTHPKVVQETLERMFGGVVPFEVREVARFETVGTKVGVINAEIWNPSIMVEEVKRLMSVEEYEYIAICNDKYRNLAPMIGEFQGNVGMVKSQGVSLIKRGVFLQIGFPKNLEDAILHEGFSIKEV